MGDCLVALARNSEARECYEQALSFCVEDSHQKMREHCEQCLVNLVLSPKQTHQGESIRLH
jgi:predicted negative regulator of RcsB-dependent stress response